jgi:hypothetical protein
MESENRGKIEIIANLFRLLAVADLGAHAALLSPNLAPSRATPSTAHA